jgi:cell division protein FtsB
MTGKSALNLGLLALLLLLQWPLWLGGGSLWEVRKLQTQLQAQQAEIATKKERNARMAADLKDLQEGYGAAAESQARRELGMIKNDEVFIQVSPAATRVLPTAAPASASAQPASGTTRGAPSP